MTDDAIAKLPNEQHRLSFDDPTLEAPTETLHVVTLPSRIESVAWGLPAAVPGGRVRLMIQTRWVGEGAPLKITLKDARGRAHGAFSDHVFGNRFEVDVAVPERARGGLLATAELTDLAAEPKRALLALWPSVVLRDPRWLAARVREGEEVGLSARFESEERLDGLTALVTIFERWGAGERVLFDPLVAFPVVIRGGRIEATWRCAYARDRAGITSQPAFDAYAAAHGEEAGTYAAPSFVFRVAILGLEADSEPLPLCDWVEIKLADAFGHPAAGAAYVLYLPDGSERKGRLDASGEARERDVPPGPVFVEFPEEGGSVVLPL